MSTFKKHLAAVECGEVTKANVIGLKKATSAFERRRAGYSTGMTAPDWTVAEMQKMAKALRLFQPRVLGELHETGMKQLRDRRYAKRWSPFQRSVIDRLDHFRLVGIISVGRWSYAAVFRAVAFGGEGFFFYNVPWQTAMSESIEGGPHSVDFRVDIEGEIQTLREQAREICKREPGYGTHNYRGDPYEAVALQQKADRLERSL